MLAWFKKFAGCFLAGIAIFNLAILFAELLPLSVMQNFPMLSGYLLLAQILVPLLLAIDYTVSWHRKEKRGEVNSVKRYGIVLTIIRYWLAFEISIYGFAKILGTQFGRSFIRKDRLVSALSGFELTWNYFGYSYAFAVIIALVQVGGALLLLSRRTTLPGVIVLLPVMINIVLINIFYQIAFGAFFNSVFITVCLLYLLLWHWREVLEVFKNASSSLPALNAKTFELFTPFVIIGAAFGYIYYLADTHPHVVLEGKWTVRYLLRNGDTLPENAWISDTHAWKNIYIEPYQHISFSSNPYLYDESRALTGFYNYYGSRKELMIGFREGDANDSLRILINNYKDSEMEWKTVYMGDSLSIKLSKNY